MPKKEDKSEEKEKNIQIAVRFLMNPSIGTSDDMKKKFLKSKGKS